jgi:hypothetical protein
VSLKLNSYASPKCAEFCTAIENFDVPWQKQIFSIPGFVFSPHERIILKKFLLNSFYVT